MSDPIAMEVSLPRLAVEREVCGCGREEMAQKKDSRTLAERQMGSRLGRQRGREMAPVKEH